jgi:hypothetical protein
VLTKAEWQAKTKRLEAARVRMDQFVAAGGDIQSADVIPLGRELFDTWDDLSTAFGHPTWKKTDGR